MIKRCIKLFLSLIVLFASIFLSNNVVNVKADEGTYSLSTSSIDNIMPNYSSSLYVYSSNLENVSSLSIEIHYTSKNVKIDNIYNNVTCTMYDSNIEEDTVKISYLFDGTSGENNKTCLFYLYFAIKEDATIGTDYFDILVKEAYDVNLNSINFNNVRTNFIIQEQKVVKSCYIYSSVNGNNAKKDEIISINYYTYTYDIESGSFMINYDDELLEFDSIENGNYLKDKIVDINSSYKSSIYISFVSTTTSSFNDLFAIKFKVKQNKTITTKVEMTPYNLYDTNLDNVSASLVSTDIYLIEDENYTEDKPIISLSTNFDSLNNQLILKVKLDKDTHLGAGDFVINFNTNNLAYNSYNKLVSYSFFNVNDKEVNDGIIKFSIINLTDIVEENEILEIIFTPTLYCEKTYNVDFEISGSGTSDSLTNSIVLNYKSCSSTINKTGHVNLTHHEKEDATCTSSGKVEYWSCDACNKTFKDAKANDEITNLIIPALGHTMTYNEKIEATCTEDGILAHYHCASCNKNYEDVDGNNELTTLKIDKLGHDLIHHERKEATCEEDGNIEYYSCTRCNKIFQDEGITEITNVVINKTGHSLFLHSFKEAANNEDGNIEYYECSKCHKYYKDNNCEKELTQDEIIIKYKSNNWFIIGSSSSGFIVLIIILVKIFIKKKKIL